MKTDALKNHLLPSTEIISVACALGAFAIGATAFAGWMFRIPSLRSVLPEHQAIPAEIATGLVAAALALFLQRREKLKHGAKVVADACSLFCVGLGALVTLSLPCQGLHFVGIGAALLTLNWQTRRGRRPAQILAILSILAPAQVLLGAFYGSNSFLFLGAPFFFFEPTAILTAVAWILLSIGLLFARPASGVMAVFTAHSLPGRIVRRLLVPALVIPPLMGYFIAHSGHLTLAQASFTASLVTLASMVIFIFDLFKNGIELHGVQADRDHAEYEMRRAIAVAEEANRAKSNFLANMSHEIRSPVGVMMGFADLIADSDCSPEERAQYIRIMKRNGQALLTIIDDILDLSKVEADKLKVQICQVDLNALINDVALVHAALAKSKGIQFYSRIDGELPQIIMSDPVRLRQILTNVLGNAVKFTASGSVSLVTKILDSHPLERSFTIGFEITDTGRGMKVEHLSKLYQPFMQGDPSITRQHGGSGLGLALSKRLAKILNGDIELKETALDKGTRFLISIKAQLPEEVSFPQAFTFTKEDLEPPKAQEKRARPLAGLKVLLVDDAADNRTLMKWILNHEGAEVELACNGTEAIEKALQNPHDVILMDLQMPIMDGLTATGILRERGYDKPIVALTAHAMKEDRDRSILNGLNDHISKPVHRESLVNKLMEYVHAEAAS